MDVHKKAPMIPKSREAMVRSVVEGGLIQADAAYQCRRSHTTGSRRQYPRIPDQTSPALQTHQLNTFVTFLFIQASEVQNVFNGFIFVKSRGDKARRVGAIADDDLVNYIMHLACIASDDRDEADAVANATLHERVQDSEI